MLTYTLSALQSSLQVGRHAPDDVVVKVFIDRVKGDGWTSSLKNSVAIALLTDSGLQVGLT